MGSGADGGDRSGGQPRLLLVVRLSGVAYGLPAVAVERILPMAAVTPLAPSPTGAPGPAGVVGVLNVHGAVLPVVDPRPRLAWGGRAGLESGPVTESVTPRHPSQRLVLISTPTRYLLWVDEAEQTVWAPAASFTRLEGQGILGEGAPLVVQADGEVLPVLSPETLAPSPVAPAAGGSGAA
jgi:chemotaxis signal transduction protein